MRRHVLVTGANRGLGLELARQCAARGDLVFGTCRHPDGAAALHGVGGVEVLALDVTDEAGIGACARRVAERTDRLDLLVHNAGVNATAFGVDRARAGVLELGADAFLGQMRVNALGPMLVTRALLPQLRASERPVIVHVSSQLGALSLGTSMLRDVGYNASKAALNMVMRALAGTLQGDGAVVVSIHPGWVRTDMGGAAADLPVAASAAGVLRTVDGLGAADNGAFLTWEGETHPW